VAAAQAVQKKKLRHLLAPLGAGQRVLLHGEVLAAFLQRGRVGEQLVVIGSGLCDGLVRREFQHLRVIDAVGAVFSLELLAQRGLRGAIERRIGLAVYLLRGQALAHAPMSLQAALWRQGH
jgi:hypothetical protein